MKNSNKLDVNKGDAAGKGKTIIGSHKFGAV
jgi:hypothetical protein